MQNISVFVFAHQDDEFGAYPEIVRLIKNGTKVLVVYLTSGSLLLATTPLKETLTSYFFPMTTR